MVQKIWYRIGESECGLNLGNTIWKIAVMKNSENEDSWELDAQTNVLHHGVVLCVIILKKHSLRENIIVYWVDKKSYFPAELFFIN